MKTAEIFEKLKSKLGEKVETLKEVVRDHSIIVKPQEIEEVCLTLRDTAEFKFESLMCISGVDFPDRLEVVYHLFSFSNLQRLTLKVVLSRENPRVPTVENIWKSANWLERETFDMFGVIFEKNRDLRRILLPEDWEGYPLRKDYKPQEFYRGVLVGMKPEEKLQPSKIMKG